MDAEVTVAAVRGVGPDAIAVEIDTPAGFDARPGQFVKLTATVESEEVSRFYTISSPRVGETFEITLTVDEEGELGPYLAGLSPGDSIHLAGPFGDAYYEGERAVLVLAGGPGVGPAVGIAERALDDGGRPAIVYQDAAPIHRDRLDALADAGASITVLDPDATLAPAVEEALDALAERGEQAGSDDDRAGAFVYGFAAFVDRATDALVAAGADGEAAKIENFGPEPG